MVEPRKPIDATLLDITEGEWCDHCKLPSAAALRYALTPRMNPMLWIGEHTTFVCRDCGITTYVNVPR